MAINLDIDKTMDVMQHIREIYNILGTTSVTSGNDIISQLAALDTRGKKLFIGTNEEYAEEYGAGHLENTLCFITDDFVS